jgi:hypothetical protein
MILRATRILLRYKGLGRTVSSTEVTDIVYPLPTMMKEGKVGLREWGKETILGLGVVWYETSESTTKSVGGLGCEDMGYEESKGRHPHRAIERGARVDSSEHADDGHGWWRRQGLKRYGDNLDTAEHERSKSVATLLRVEGGERGGRARCSHGEQVS